MASIKRYQCVGLFSAGSVKNKHSSGTNCYALCFDKNVIFGIVFSFLTVVVVGYSNEEVAHLAGGDVAGLEPCPRFVTNGTLLRIYVPI
jgi:hypothetical protein